MKVVSRVQFPKTNETACLYIKSENQSVDVQIEESKITFPAGSTVSLNTYFNSIYEKFYTKYTKITTLYYLLRLDGDFAVSVYRENQTNEKELLDYQTFKQAQISEYVKVILPALKQGEEAGRIYLEITCLSEQCFLTEGLVVTEQEDIQDVSLAIISCTYKKEVYIKNTVKNILQDKLLQNKQFKIFVVDNAKTLEQSDFYHPQVKLIYNRNVGGSGGFTKGLIEALQEGSYTHFLFMDDDIELDSEVIYRLFSLYEYAQQDFAVSGSMLDLYKKYVLYEAGALYNQEFDDEGNLNHELFTITSLKNNLDLRKPTSLNSLLLEEDIDYGAFWFFSFSQKVVQKIGLPLPFFIKIDDVEFGLRVKQNVENGIVAFPSLAVWHEPFYAKRPIWDAYYSYRNMLITASIHGLNTYFSVSKSLMQAIIYYLLKFDYNYAEMYVKAFEDYLQGPNLFINQDPEAIHTQIFALSKSHPSQTIISNPLSNKENYQLYQAGTLKKFLSLLTLNGHLLPSFLISDESITILASAQARDSLCKGFAKKRLICIDDYPNCYQNELDSQAGIKIFMAGLKSMMKSLLSWSKVNAEWKEAAQDLSSIPFWQNYLQTVRE